MFRVKICGITNIDDARMVADSGADAIGLNFYSKSSRFISIEQAESIIAALPDAAHRVGLFVNSTDDEVCRTYDHLQLDLIQLHGNEPPEFLTSLGGRPVLRAFRLGSGGVRPVLSYLNECESLGCPPAGVLIDAYQPGQFGGTGETADWDRLADERTQFNDLPLILAGGLRADNVAEAIQKVKPDGVDTASGVEKTTGKKDAESVRNFVAAAFAARREVG